MKKTLLTFGLAGGLALSSYAQLAENAVAPDFTLTDINGVSHNLYSYLDSGYSVMIDVSATWCGPCWAGHQSDFMNKLEEEYGTNGTVDPGKIKVIFIEGDPSTTSNDLHGTGSNTQGDWVSGQNYIIIDDNAVNQHYLAGGFPTYTLITPNRRVQIQNAGFSTAMAETSFWASHVENAPMKVDGDNVGVIYSPTPEINCTAAGTEVNLITEIQNLGTTPITSATVTASVGGTVIATENWTGNLAATFDSDEIDFGNFSLGAETDNEVVYEVTMTGDNTASDNSLTKSVVFAVTPESRDWVLKVRTDANPRQNAWGILNADRSQVIMQGEFADANTREYEINISLNAGTCYYFLFIDVGDDGMEATPAGEEPAYIRLYEADGTTLVKEYPVNFGSQILDYYKTGQVSSIEDLITSDKDIQVYPNPSSDQLTAEFPLKKDAQVTFSFVNLLGQQIGRTIHKDLKVGNSTVKLDVSGLSVGMYILNVHSGDGAYQYKFTKK